MTNIFGERLKKLRKENGLTQSELVEKVNEKYGTAINRTTISKWENGTQEASMSFVVALANFFQVSLDYINGAEDENKKTTAEAEAKENRIIDMYSRLNPQNQALLDSLLESMLEQQDKNN